jgi:hypothetical protein
MDAQGIDGAVNGIGAGLTQASTEVKKFQTGRIGTYQRFIVAAVVVLLVILIVIVKGAA